MKKLLKNRGFTLTEVLVAILIISVASAALAASVSSAAKINSENLKNDINYIGDLKEANEQNPSSSSGSSVSISDGSVSYTHDVYVYGEGDLSTANSDVVHPEKGGETDEGSHPVQYEDEDDDEEEEDVPVPEDDPAGSVEKPDGRKARLHGSNDLFRYTAIAISKNHHYVMNRNAQPGDLIIVDGRYFLVIKELSRNTLDNSLWYNYGINNISKRDIRVYYDNYSSSRTYLVEISSARLNATVVSDEIATGYSKNTLLFYKGKYYYSIDETTVDDKPGESSKWVEIKQ